METNINKNEEKKWNGSEREFLHDLCNYLAISYGNIKLVQTKIGNNPNSIDAPALLERIEKIASSFEKANSLLNMRRDFLKSKE